MTSVAGGGKIAGVLAARGELDVALAMWRESGCLPVTAAPDLIKIAEQWIEYLEARRR